MACKSPLHLWFISLPSTHFRALRSDRLGGRSDQSGLDNRPTCSLRTLLPPGIEAFTMIFNNFLPSRVFSRTTSLARILSLTFFGLSSPTTTFFPLAPSACSSRISTLALLRSMCGQGRELYQSSSQEKSIVPHLWPVVPVDEKYYNH